MSTGDIGTPNAAQADRWRGLFTVPALGSPAERIEWLFTDPMVRLAETVARRVPAAPVRRRLPAPAATGTGGAVPSPRSSAPPGETTTLTPAPLRDDRAGSAGAPAPATRAAAGPPEQERRAGGRHIDATLASLLPAVAPGLAATAAPTAASSAQPASPARGHPAGPLEAPAPPAASSAPPPAGTQLFHHDEAAPNDPPQPAGARAHHDTSQATLAQGRPAQASFGEFPVATPGAPDVSPHTAASKVVRLVTEPAGLAAILREDTPAPHPPSSPETPSPRHVSRPPGADPPRAGTGPASRTSPPAPETRDTQAPADGVDLDRLLDRLADRLEFELLRAYGEGGES